MGLRDYFDNDTQLRHYLLGSFSDYQGPREYEGKHRYLKSFFRLDCNTKEGTIGFADMDYEGASGKKHFIKLVWPLDRAREIVEAKWPGSDSVEARPHGE